MKTKTKFAKANAVFIAALMAIGLLLSAVAMPQQQAFANNEGTLNIHKLESEGYENQPTGDGKTYVLAEGKYYAYLAGAEYTVYKIGTFTQTDVNGVVQVKYEAIPGLVYENNGGSVVLNDSTDPSRIDVSGLTAVRSGTTTGTGPLVFTGANGLDENTVYLVKESKTPTGVNVATNFIITVPMYVNDQWTNTIDAYPKNTTSDPQISKEIIDANGNKAYVNVGETVSYQIDVKAPQDMNSGIYSKFVITDTPSQYLAIDMNTVKIVHRDIAGETLTETTVYGPGPSVPGNDFTVAYTNNQLIITLLNTTGTGLVKNGDELIITYEATVLAGAAGNETGAAKNKVQLDLDLAEGPVVPVDPEPEVKVYSYGVKKVKEDGLTPLADATFVVATKTGIAGAYERLEYDSVTKEWDVADTDADVTKFTTTVSTGTPMAPGDEAILQFWNLDKDTTYYLIEIEAPDDYNILPDAIAIKADADSTDKVYSSYAYNENTQNYDYVTGGYSVSIQNTLESEYPGGLPSTGGAGILWYFIIGAVLIGGAATLYVYNRKKNQKANESKAE